MEAPLFDTEDAIRINIRAEALGNEAFVQAIRTGRYQQVAVMTLPPDGEIGERVLDHTDQLFVVVDGMGEARIGQWALGVESGDLVFVEAGTRHNIVNRAVAPLRLIAVWAEPLVAPRTVARTPSDARIVCTSPDPAIGLAPGRRLHPDPALAHGSRSHDLDDAPSSGRRGS